MSLRFVFLFLISLSKIAACSDLSTSNLQLYLDGNPCQTNSATNSFSHQDHHFIIDKIVELPDGNLEVSFTISDDQDTKSVSLVGKCAESVPEISQPFTYDKDQNYEKNLERAKAQFEHCVTSYIWENENGFEVFDYWRPKLVWESVDSLEYDKLEFKHNKKCHTVECYANFKIPGKNATASQILFRKIDLKPNDLSDDQNYVYVSGKRLYKAKISLWDGSNEEEKTFLEQAEFKPYKTFEASDKISGYLGSEVSTAGFYKLGSITEYLPSLLAYYWDGSFMPALFYKQNLIGPISNPNDTVENNITVKRYQKPSNSALIFKKGKSFNAQKDPLGDGFYELCSTYISKGIYIQKWYNVVSGSETTTTNQGFPIGLRLHTKYGQNIGWNLDLSEFFNNFNNPKPRITISKNKIELDAPEQRNYDAKLFRFGRKNNYSIFINFEYRLDLTGINEPLSAFDLVYLSKNVSGRYTKLKHPKLAKIKIDPDSEHAQKAINSLNKFADTPSIDLSSCDISGLSDFSEFLAKIPSGGVLDLTDTTMSDKQIDQLYKALGVGLPWKDDHGEAYALLCEIKGKVKWRKKLNYFKKADLRLYEEDGHEGRYRKFNNYCEKLIGLEKIITPSSFALSNRFLENLNLSPNLTELSLRGLRLGRSVSEKNFLSAILRLTNLEKLDLISKTPDISNDCIEKLARGLAKSKQLKYLGITLPYDSTNIKSGYREMHEDLCSTNRAVHGVFAVCYTILSPVLAPASLAVGVYNDLIGARSRDWYLTLQHIAGIKSLETLAFYDRAKNDYGQVIKNIIEEHRKNNDCSPLQYIT